MVGGVERHRSGVVAALAAFAIWGVLPAFWKNLDFIRADVIVAQRTVWSLLVLWLLALWRREPGSVVAVLWQPSLAAWCLLSGLLLAANWLLYVWATLNGHILEAALGYYLNPFFNMAFGAWWFGDRHSRGQRLAIGLAFCGVLLQMPAIGRFPWVAMVLACTFSLYAVVKKRVPLPAHTSLMAETALLAPLALLWLSTLAAGPGGVAQVFGGSWPHALWVASTGLATTLPLLCFGHAARNIRLSTLGILQFLAPSLQFLLGWLLYREPMTPLRLASFALIWLAIALYARESLRAGSATDVRAAEGN
jgi:chloramphenicol-sensitive protein RarD